MSRLKKMSYRSIVGAVACLSLAGAALGLSAGWPQAALAAPGDDRLTQAVGALRAISTMTADFVQTDRSGKSIRGKLTIKRPGRIRFAYEPSAKMLIVGDGKALTFVDYEVKQVQRWPISNSPLGALLDPNRDVAQYGKLVPTGNANVVSIEVRDKAHPEYGVITLIFMRGGAAPGGLELVYWVALDSQNQQTKVQLSNQRYGVAVPDSTFRWTDPRPNTRR